MPAENIVILVTVHVAVTASFVLVILGISPSEIPEKRFRNCLLCCRIA